MLGCRYGLKIEEPPTSSQDWRNGSYKTVRLKDKKDLIRMVKRIGVIEESCQNRFVVVGGVVFNGFNIDEAEMLCRSAGITNFVVKKYVRGGNE